ncbi:hypothetical protein IC006_0064 [Sulfuracidifex tepidarius]|uniref:UPF0284 protein IC006_0064 n=1 Tax=Sulfuracidifex tepidarius TaxID=1294262 RepID=A0A510DRK7_9CREN|nr:TIGR00303 family protein [Sulfuracidifex tepidarius]BBG22780.1 hypothetical protein IC006_0064 [Sulfuracidifex tepidarius]
MLQDKVLFTLIIGTTDVSLIPGITIAGATPELTMFTPAADAEFLINGRCQVINGVPITPDGIPSPAIISRASLNLTGVPSLVVNGGTRIKPTGIPFIEVGGEPGKDIREGALDKEVMIRMRENAERLGRQLSRGFDTLIIGESIPAGTTTALSTLLALGYKAFGKVSSASPNNPVEIKESVVKQALIDLPEDKIEKLSRVSDPMIITASALAEGFENRVVLAGGTQMTAVAAVIKEFSPGKVKDLSIWTTRWIIEDKRSDIIGLASEVGVKVDVSQLDFSSSKIDGLKAYDKGYVKEGVGAGGLSLLAMKMGFTKEEVMREVEKVYEEARNEKI